MPKQAIDDGDFLNQPLNGGRTLLSKRDLFQRAAVIMKFIKENPGCSSLKTSKALAETIGISEVTIGIYLKAMESSDLLKNLPQASEGGAMRNTWYLADWLM